MRFSKLGGETLKEFQNNQQILRGHKDFKNIHEFMPPGLKVLFQSYQKSIPPMMHSIYPPIAILSPGNGTSEQPTDIVSKVKQNKTKQAFPPYLWKTIRL